MSVHLNTSMQGRHRLQVFPSTSWIEQYCPWSCFDVSSCFSLLWTWRILGESTIGGFVPIVLLFTDVLLVVPLIVSHHFVSCVLLYVHIKFRHCCVSTNLVVLSLTLHPLLLTLSIAVVSFSGAWSCFIGKGCANWLHNMFACYNINCYSSFSRTAKRGLNQHLFRNPGGQQYMNQNGTMRLNGSVNGLQQIIFAIRRQCISHGIRIIITTIAYNTTTLNSPLASSYAASLDHHLK
jgi:hypothetical protein